MYAYIALFALLAGRLTSTPVVPDGESHIEARSEQHHHHHGTKTGLRHHNYPYPTAAFEPLTHPPTREQEKIFHEMEARRERSGERKPDEHRHSQPLSHNPIHRRPHRETDPYEITVTIKTTEVPHRASRPHRVDPTTHSHSRHGHHTPASPSHHTPSTHREHSHSTHHEHSPSPHSSSHHGSLSGFFPHHTHSSAKHHPNPHHGTLSGLRPPYLHPSSHHKASSSRHHSSSHHGLLTPLFSPVSPPSSKKTKTSSKYTPGTSIVPVSPSKHHTHPSSKKPKSTSIPNTVIVPVSPSKHHSHPSPSKPKSKSIANTVIVPVSHSTHHSHPTSKKTKSSVYDPGFSIVPVKTSSKPKTTKDRFLDE